MQILDIEQHLQAVLAKKKARLAYRSLQQQPPPIDFCSNDYLGFATHPTLLAKVHTRLHTYTQIGSTGSRLLSGNSALVEQIEQQIAAFHQAPSALIFNSGYDANIGIYPTFARRNDVILFDALVHASVHDGMRLSKATCIPFTHNNTQDLADKLATLSTQQNVAKVFISLESVYSMDGDVCPLAEIVTLAKQYHAHIIIDEAHATGVIGQHGQGLVQHLGLEKDVFLRMHTFGKALGTHGAVVLGSNTVRQYLVNFCRPFIFTTAPPIHTLIAISEAYKLLSQSEALIQQLHHNIHHFRTSVLQQTTYQLLPSTSPIQSIIVPGNSAVRKLAHHLQCAQFDARPIIPPTVAAGSERIRLCIHAFNTPQQINALVHTLRTYPY